MALFVWENGDVKFIPDWSSNPTVRPDRFMKLVDAAFAPRDKYIHSDVKTSEELHAQAKKLANWAAHANPDSQRTWEGMYDRLMDDFKKPSKDPEAAKLAAMCAAATYARLVACNGKMAGISHEVNVGLKDRGFNPEDCPICHPPPPK